MKYFIPAILAVGVAFAAPAMAAPHTVYGAVGESSSYGEVDGGGASTHKYTAEANSQSSNRSYTNGAESGTTQQGSGSSYGNASFDYTAGGAAAGIGGIFHY